MITFADIQAAAKRLSGRIRRTPTVEVTEVVEPVTAARLALKLENLQATGSFKARGATNKLLSLPQEDLKNGLVTASGGNHGLAVARAARMAGVPATIFVTESATCEKIDKLKRWGARVEVLGAVWNETNEAALALADETGAAYFHPFADPLVVAGQGTAGLELLEALPHIDVLLVAIGGGGLISGLSVAVKALKPSVRIIGIEPEGSPTLKASLDAGCVVRLDSVTSRVATMSCGETEESVFELVRRNVDEIVLVSDEAMQDSADWLWFEMGIAADLSGAASIAALKTGTVEVPAGKTVGGLVCGAGSDAFSR